MPTRKVAVTLDENALARLDRLVAAQQYTSRSRAVQAAVDSFLAWKTRRRLAEECAKLDPAEEIALAEEGLSWEAQEWPAY